MSNNNGPIHFVLFPLMAQGHMIPMIDIAKLVAQGGVMVTIVTTHGNAARFEGSVEQAVGCGLPIRTLKLCFPWEQVGLPKGCENLDMLPDYNGMAYNLYAGAALLQAPAEEALLGMLPPPTCIISDTFLPWTLDIAAKLHIPRIVFSGSSIFFVSSLVKLACSDLVNTLAPDAQAFVVPGLPDRVHFTKHQLSLSAPNDDLAKFFKWVWAADRASYGTILNSFEELEPGYLEVYKRSTGHRVWCVGPVSLCNENQIDKTQRGNKADLDEHTCLKWLDSCPKGSVVYASLGTLCALAPSQMMELGLGLEASGKPFIWVIREGNKMDQVERLIKEDGFEERIKGRGMLVWGWAPQLLILSHPSIGGFLTHCGWNSTLEGICAGLPLITWPLFADQFANQKLVDQVLKIGVAVEMSIKRGEEEAAEVLVKREDVERAIRRAMDKGEEGETRRKKARELGKLAKGVVKKGGSSHNNLSMLIQDVMNQMCT